MITPEPIDLGPLEPLLSDPEISEIFIDGYDRISVDRRGRLEDVEAGFASPADLLNLIRAVIAPYGYTIDPAQPMVDVRLADRSRLTAVMPPVSPEGPAMVIRKFRRDRLTLEQLLGFGALTPAMAGFLQACVGGGATILVAGGAGSGKTTLMNCLCRMIRPAERLLVIAEELELAVEHRRAVRLEPEPGVVDTAGLIRQALKMRPERIIVGELAGAEVPLLLQAILNGHNGSMALIHAASPADALARLEIMATMAEAGLPLSTLRGQIASAFDMIVQINLGPDGVRRLTRVSEVAGVERDQITLNDIFRYDDETGFYATRHRPAFLDQLRARGVEVDPAWFGG